MTTEQIEELKALQESNDALDRPSAIHQTHWDEGVCYREICGAGYAKRYARQPRGFSKDFFGVKITQAGRELVADM